MMQNLFRLQLRGLRSLYRSMLSARIHMVKGKFEHESGHEEANAHVYARMYPTIWWVE